MPPRSRSMGVFVGGLLKRQPARRSGHQVRNRGSFALCPSIWGLRPPNQLYQFHGHLANRNGNAHRNHLDHGVHFEHRTTPPKAVLLRGRILGRHFRQNNFESLHQRRPKGKQRISPHEFREQFRDL